LKGVPAKSVSAEMLHRIRNTRSISFGEKMTKQIFSFAGLAQPLLTPCFSQA
jgi:hypothetical protein